MLLQTVESIFLTLYHELDVCLGSVHCSSKSWIAFTACHYYGNYRYVLLQASQILMNWFGSEVFGCSCYGLAFIF